jgi:hypothetical protein
MGGTLAQLNKKASLYFIDFSKVLQKHKIYISAQVVK